MLEAEAIAKAFYSALARGDSDAAFALLTPEIEWMEAEHSSYYAGTITGVESIVRTVFAPISRDFADFACTPSDFISQGDRTASFGFYTGRAKIGGGELKAPFVHVWTAEKGLLTRFHQFTDTAAWARAMISG